MTSQTPNKLCHEYAVLSFADGREGIALQRIALSEVLLKVVQSHSKAYLPDLPREHIRLWSIAEHHGHVMSVEDLVKAVKVRLLQLMCCNGTYQPSLL